MVLWLLQEWPPGPGSGQDVAGLLGTTATSQRTSGVWPPGWPRSAPSGQGGVRATTGCRGECSQRCRAGSCGQAPSASWVSSEDWSGVSPAGPARWPRPGPKAFLLEEAAVVPHWAWALGGTPRFSPGRFLWVFSVARAGPSLQHVSTCSPGGKGCRPGLGTHSGLAMSDPSTCARRSRAALSGCAAVPCSAWVRLPAPETPSEDSAPGC